MTSRPRSARQLGGEVERPLLADGLDDPLAETPVGQRLHRLDDPPVVVHGDRLRRAHRPRDPERERPPRDRDHPRPGVGREPGQQRARESRCRRSPPSARARSRPARRMFIAQPSGSPGNGRPSSAAGRRHHGRRPRRRRTRHRLLGERHHPVAGRELRRPQDRPRRRSPRPRGRARRARSGSASTPAPPRARRWRRRRRIPRCRTRTSPGPGSGIATSSTTVCRGPVTTAARIVPAM